MSLRHISTFGAMVARCFYRPGPVAFGIITSGPTRRLPPMPEWMRIVEPKAPPVPEIAARIQRQPLSRYAEAALDDAVKSIISAPAGVQRDTLNLEIYSIARLVADGVLPAGLAIESLQWAARQVRSYDLSGCHVRAAAQQLNTTGEMWGTSRREIPLCQCP